MSFSGPSIDQQLDALGGYSSLESGNAGGTPSSLQGIDLSGVNLAGMEFRGLGDEAVDFNHVVSGDTMGLMQFADDSAGAALYGLSLGRLGQYQGHADRFLGTLASGVGHNMQTASNFSNATMSFIGQGNTDGFVHTYHHYLGIDPQADSPGTQTGKLTMAIVPFLFKFKGPYRTGKFFDETIDNMILSNPKAKKFQTRHINETEAIRREFNQSDRASYLRYYGETTDPAKLAQRFTPSEIAAIQKGQVPRGWVVHHMKPIYRGGTNSYDNLRLMKREFHEKHFDRLHYYDDGANPYGRN